jgi:hypothetical protein
LTTSFGPPSDRLAAQASTISDIHRHIEITEIAELDLHSTIVASGRRIAITTSRFKSGANLLATIDSLPIRKADHKCQPNLERIRC